MTNTQFNTETPLETSVDRPRIRVTPDNRVDTNNAAAFLGIKKKTMANWRSRGEGPPWRKVAGLVFYDWPGLQAFARGHD